MQDNNTIEDSIKFLRKQGRSDQEIKRILLISGWSEEEIDAALGTTAPGGSSTHEQPSEQPQTQQSPQPAEQKQPPQSPQPGLETQSNFIKSVISIIILVAIFAGAYLVSAKFIFHSWPFDDKEDVNVVDALEEEREADITDDGQGVEKKEVEDKKEKDTGAVGAFDCGENVDCFVAKFAKCEPGKMTVRIAIFPDPSISMDYDYEIIGKKSTECLVKIKLVKDPGVGFGVGKEMSCLLDNSKDYSEVFLKTFEDATGCQGTLADAIIERNEEARQYIEGNNKRTNDMFDISNAVSRYSKNNGWAFCKSSKTIYASAKITPPPGWTLGGNPGRTAIDGTGWIPIDFRGGERVDFDKLPVDPINDPAKGYVYLFACDPETEIFELNTRLEPGFGSEYNSLTGDDDEISEFGDLEALESGSKLIPKGFYDLISN